MVKLEHDSCMRLLYSTCLKYLLIYNTPRIRTSIIAKVYCENTNSCNEDFLYRISYETEDYAYIMQDKSNSISKVRDTTKVLK